LKKYILYLITALLGFYACTPQDEVITFREGALLTFSTDTILFDTVFAEVKTASRRFKIYNRNQNAVKVGEVRMSAESSFTAYVNGQKLDRSTMVKDLFIRGGDSVLVLIEARIDASNKNNPFVIADSIVFSTNGYEQKVQVRAWGQDAIFLNNTIVDCNAVWDSLKPYVIYNSIAVDENCTLTIKEGTRIYASPTTVIFVLGTLKIQGTRNHPVRIGGLRLERRYQNVPDQWKSIWFLNGSRDNEIHYAEIKNGERGIQVGTPGDNRPPDLVVANSRIRNMLESGIFCVNPSKLTLYNSVISDCGSALVRGYNGGTYEFYHNTFAYSNTLGFIRDTPSVFFSDILDERQTDNQYVLDLNFVNNLVAGSNSATGRTDREFVYYLRNTNNAHKLSIRNNVLRTTDVLFDAQTEQVQQNRRINSMYRFLATSESNFRLDTLQQDTIAKNRGYLEIISQKPFLNTDLDNALRPFGPKPDIGAYEQHR
jgi:hypothetical protein